uniref:non-specific serine/threonine protein kinase n=1 Tax=Musa acuminata subsp. malaccensis TaxID=214687 RepID=A0A804K2F3_MUSAM|nr:PREDICTED: L-type lectin-domain containing receptor kinase IX.1-like [Musa acuminata subsp. malaccensis]
MTTLCRSWVFSTFYCLSFAVPLATSLSFNFSSFDQSSLSKIQLQRDAYVANDRIQLTKNQLDGSLISSGGRAVYGEPLLLWDPETRELTDFTTRFAFAINGLNASLIGDGVAFFLSSYPSTIPPISLGGGLGLFNITPLPANSTINNTVAVEFDTYNNSFDTSANHIGIDVNSVISSKVVDWRSNITDGREVNAWVSYNASTHNLSVFMTYAQDAGSSNSSLSYVIDLRDVLPEKVAVGFSAATGNRIETNALLSWSFNSSLQPKTTLPAPPAAKRKSKMGLAVGGVIGAAVLMVLLGSLGLILWRRRTTGRDAEDEEELEFDRNMDDEFERERGPKRFAYQELADATRNFSEEEKLGEGGFGSVYRGYLKDSKLEVAIKRISRGSKQGRKEYVSEVKIISRLRHRNLVQLVGWCHDRGEFSLVYEFMPNGSLDSYLYSTARLLEWPARHRVALGLASALLYLHEEWEQCVVHRDVKPSNVMLDSAFNAKLGDFGLARLVDHDRGSQTTVLAGTMGYLAPECVNTGKASKESDVYSFGILALEIACGRRPVQLMEQASKVRLVEWVWELYGRRRLLEAADEKLGGVFDEKQMECLMVVGLWCAHPDYDRRPSIKQVINVLNLEAPFPELPPSMPVPMYYAPPIEAYRFSYASSAAGTTSASSASTACVTDSSNLNMSRGSSSTTSHLLKFQ